MNLIPSAISRTAITAAALSLLVLSGCAATGTSGSGYQRADAATGSLNSVRNEIDSTRPVIAEAVAKVNALVNQPTSDLQSQYEEFVAALRSAQQREQPMQRSVSAMQLRRDAYMQRWQDDIDAITNRSLQDRALGRRDDTNAKFNELDAKLETIKQDYRLLLRSLSDLRHYLASDLTASGVASVNDQVEQAREHEGELQNAMEDVIDLLDELSTMLAATTAAGE